MNLWTVFDFYNNQKFIAENLCVNRFDKIPICKGHCYLSKELKKVNKETGSKSASLKVKLAMLLYSETTLAININSTITALPTKFKFFQPQHKTKSLSHSIFHPPIVA